MYNYVYLCNGCILSMQEWPCLWQYIIYASILTPNCDQMEGQGKRSIYTTVSNHGSVGIHSCMQRCYTAVYPLLKSAKVAPVWTCGQWGSAWSRSTKMECVHLIPRVYRQRDKQVEFNCSFPLSLPMLQLSPLWQGSSVWGCQMIALIRDYERE